MTPEQETLLSFCDGNTSALALINDFWEFAEVYDDAIDGEKKQTDAEIHKAFHWALFGLAANSFYQAHRRPLEAAMQVAIADWRAANELERSGQREQLVTAYTLRCSPYSFFVAVVLAAAGAEAAAQASFYFRSKDTPDRLDVYLREHNVKD